MSDVGSDLDAAWTMVYDAQDRLKVKEKDHELIRFLFLRYKSDREFAWQELLRKFSKDPTKAGNVRGAMECAYAIAQYLIALEVALGERMTEPMQVIQVGQEPFDSDNHEVWHF